MKLCTITGSRAEFFLLKNLITKINNEKKLKNNLLVTGSHNSALFGNTIKDIKQSNIKIKAIVNLKIKNDRPTDISKYISEGIKKFSNHFNSIKPDLVIILGDRYEIYTAAIAAYILKIPIAHIYGGETTQGVIDEGIRHSITKLSHIHFVSTNRYLKRVKQLGENPKMIFNVGSLGIEALKNTLPHLSEIALGGTAVGTWINTPKGYDKLVASYIKKFTGLPFVTSKNKFESIAAHDAIVETHGALKQIAMSLYKIANDIRMLSSGPRSGIGEIILPSNEPGSSIMPGKINPTQCEALTMVCAQIMGNDTSISFAGSQGHFELNVFKPLMANNIIESAQLLGDSSNSFNKNCVLGIKPNHKQIKKMVENSLMLVTALNTKIGYYKSTEIANKAYNEGISLKESAKLLGYVSEKDFDKWVRPEDMIGDK